MSRKRRGSDGAAIIWVLGGLVLLAVAVEAVKWAISQALHYWYVSAVVAVLIIGIGAATVVGAVRREQERRERLARLRFTLAELDVVSPSGFEVACADLLRRDGFSAQVCGGARDRAADVIGRDQTGLTVVLQCKHTTVGGRVGSPVLYGLNGTVQDIHNAQVGVVVTNGGFTRDAPTVAGQLARIHLIDRAALERWATHGESFYGLLGLPDSRRVLPQN